MNGQRANPWIKWLLPPAILLLVAGLVALLWLSRPEVPSQPAQEPVWPVAMVTVHPGPKRPVLTLYGMLESPSTTTLNAAVAADVAAVPVSEGQQVKAGGLLVRLDDASLRLSARRRRAQVDELQAKLALERRQHESDRQALDTERKLLSLAQDNLDRIRRLARDGSASDSQVDAAEQRLQQRQLTVNQRELAVNSHALQVRQLRARIEQARAALGQAEQDLAHTRIESPFDGRVAAVSVAPGTRVSPGQPLLRLYDTSALRVRASLPADHVGRVRRALEAGETLDATARVDGRHMTLRLMRLAGQAQRGQAGVGVLFDVKDGLPDTVLGRFVTVELRLPPADGLIAVPYEALYGNGRLYKVVDGRMRRVSATRIGDAVLDDGSHVALVRSPDVAAGDRIVATQIPRAMNGLRVRAADTAEQGG